MQFKAAVAVLALFAGVVSTQSMAFHEADTGGTCGKSACQEGACILEVNGISGCTGQTDGISGPCGTQTVGDTGRDVCHSAHVVIHFGRKPHPAVHFTNAAGNEWCCYFKGYPNNLGSTSCKKGKCS